MLGRPIHAHSAVIHYKALQITKAPNGEQESMPECDQKPWSDIGNVALTQAIGTEVDVGDTRTILRPKDRIYMMVVCESFETGTEETAFSNLRTASYDIMLKHNDLIVCVKLVTLHRCASNDGTIVNRTTFGVRNYQSAGVRSFRRSIRGDHRSTSLYKTESSFCILLLLLQASESAAHAAKLLTRPVEECFERQFCTSVASTLLVLTLVVTDFA